MRGRARLPLLCGAIAVIIGAAACGGDDAAEDSGSSGEGGELIHKLNAYFPKRSPGLEPGIEVRIGGVRVGTVAEVERGRATLHIEPEFAPIDPDAKALLRQKTLLGETYVELNADPPDEGIETPRRKVNIDEIYRSLDPETRREFRRWQRNAKRKLEAAR